MLTHFLLELSNKLIVILAIEESVLILISCFALEKIYKIKCS